MLFKVGTVCVKTAGRDAGKSCIVVEELGNGLVLIDGETRRRKVNVKHLEPMGSSVVKKGASHEAAMSALGKQPRPDKRRAQKPKPSMTRKAKPKDEAQPRKAKA